LLTTQNQESSDCFEEHNGFQIIHITTHTTNTPIAPTEPPLGIPTAAAPDPPADPVVVTLEPPPVVVGAFPPDVGLGVVVGVAPPPANVPQTVGAETQALNRTPQALSGGQAQVALSAAVQVTDGPGEALQKDKV